MEYICTSCRERVSATPHGWRCPRCGGVFDLADRRPFRLDAVDTAAHDQWRYRAMLGVPEGARPVTLGEGVTPLVPGSIGGRSVLFKLEYVAPTGSFKDRLMSAVVTTLQAWGVSRAADDSSGNAGASFAAYAARAGIEAEVFAPATASPAKLAQIEVFGARLHRIEGSRDAATRAVESAARQGLVYASHAWLPQTLEGAKTVGYEVWEQLTGRLRGPASGAAADGVPDAVVCPLGQGSMFLGVHRAFADLLAAGLIARVPRMIAAQSAGCAPIVEAMRQGLDRSPAVERRPSVAEGIMLAQPLRDAEILRALRDTGGQAVGVSDADVIEARAALARAGFFVEPTSAVAAAAIETLRLEGVVVVVLTGSGLKSAT